ncbi:collagen alpha-1(X) chain-like [Daphnia carinata]|uniref:collagen alpha-1(X) chain-like n=1 Tax=Daphnia carinata TaxID=120202 RepID=UPI00257EF1AF|nr:collagen alpha-1(X) chain-like [Daphnia carinata]
MWSIIFSVCVIAFTPTSSMEVSEPFPINFYGNQIGHLHPLVFPHYMSTYRRSGDTNQYNYRQQVGRRHEYQPTYYPMYPPVGTLRQNDLQPVDRRLFGYQENEDLYRETPSTIRFFNGIARGPEGPTGLPGPAGPAGPPGAPGPQGPAGAPGPAGPAGKDGADGLPGTNGLPGNDGAPGADGTPGDPGPEGPPGVDGTPGDPGADGTPGNPGVDGTPGNPGVDGTPGTNGDPGTPGEQGPPGEQGLQGLPGEPGTPA